jgi:hypothetical protein
MRSILAVSARGLILALACVLCDGCKPKEVQKHALATACADFEVQWAGAAAGGAPGQCQCVETAAQRYLDVENAALLQEIGSLYLSDAPNIAKAKKLILLLQNANRSPRQAAMLTVDMAYFMEKTHRLCKL